MQFKFENIFSRMSSKTTKDWKLRMKSAKFDILHCKLHRKILEKILQTFSFIIPTTERSEKRRKSRNSGYIERKSEWMNFFRPFFSASYPTLVSCAFWCSIYFFFFFQLTCSLFSLSFPWSWQECVESRADCKVKRGEEDETTSTTLQRNATRNEIEEMNTKKSTIIFCCPATTATAASRARVCWRNV